MHTYLQGEQVKQRYKGLYAPTQVYLFIAAMIIV
jgi:hypothetical protein